LFARVGLGYWAGLVIGAIEDGFCGSLTTVSTLMSELMTLAALIPFSKRAYVYGGVTFGGAFVLGLAVLGWAYWVN
jgi:fluoride ion exporter CrcB/FEX